jgi:hypothetical protein
MRLTILFTALLTATIAICQINTSPDLQRRDLVQDTADAIVSAIESAVECTGCQVCSSITLALCLHSCTCDCQQHTTSSVENGYILTLSRPSWFSSRERQN